MNDYALGVPQALGTSSSPTFAGLTVTGAATFASTVDASGLLTLNPGQNKRFLSFSGSSTGEGRNFGMASTVTPNLDGTTSNDVVRFGWNVGDGSANNGRLDTSQPAAFYAIENKWLAGGRYWSEFHQYQITAAGGSYRPFSSIYPHDGGRGAQAGFNVDQFALAEWDNNSVYRFYFDIYGNKLDTTTGCIVGIGGAAVTGQALKVFGAATIAGALTLSGSYAQVASGWAINLGTGQGYLEFQNGGVRMTNQGTTTNVPLSVKGMASQSGNLQEWMNSAGTVLAHVGATGFFGGIEITAPAAPAANGYRIYAEDNGAGKTRLMCMFASGAAQQLAIEP